MERTQKYANRLSAMIQCETVSTPNQTDISKFYAFHALLKAEFPRLFSTCEVEDFSGSLLLRWQGKESKNPVCFMNHMDVVEATGDWHYSPFQGEIAEGKLWGRGALDTKSGLFAMLQAAEELLEEGFVPTQDIYFVSTRTEEVGGAHAQAIVQELLKRGIRFAFVLDEGGMIVTEPMKGALGNYAMVGVGEKGYANIKFTAHGKGGHASAPPKNTPLVRLGRFMAAVEKKCPFQTYLSPTVSETFRVIGKGMKKGPVRFLLKHNRAFRCILKRLMPAVSPQGAAMLRTTLAFTVASGSNGVNVLPEEAYVIADMRYSHHQGLESSVAAVKKVAEKYGVETEVLLPGVSSSLTDYTSPAFALLREGIQKVFPQTAIAPYLMTAASDSRFFSALSDHCLRFSPFVIDNAQLGSVHGVDENVNLKSLAPAVDFYKFVMQNFS